MRDILKLIFSMVFICLMISLSSAQGYFKVTEDIKEAYQLVSTLRFEEGKSVIAQIKKDDPLNMLVYQIENYIDFYTVFISEDKDVFEALEENKRIRLDHIEKGDKSSPYYLFSKAEINLQWATMRLKFDEKFTALSEVYTAYKLLDKNNEVFPEFIANKKSLSIIHALSESIPGVVRFFAGVEGSISLGTQEIHEVIEYSKENDFLYTPESYAIYAYILYYQNNQKKEAYDLLFNSELDHTTSPLLCFLKSNMAQKNGHTKEAIEILKERPQGDKYFPFYYLEFMLGKYQLYELHPEADKYMLSFLNNFKGRHFIKEAYQKLAWYELAINESILGYKKYMKAVQDEGYDLVDEDKQALRESKSKDIPNPTLLKARLLFDGGYYSKAYNLLIEKSYLFNKEDKNLLEFNYRMGRLSQELKNYHDAIEYYLHTLNLDNNKKTYFSCNAALQIGIIYESQNKYEDAQAYYNECLDINPREYKTSLHQKAKSGLDRIKPFLN